jgi:F0F1-type ATP synthase assembly protein I
VPEPNLIVRYARFGAMAYELSGTILAGAFVGWLLDRWLGTQPYLTLVSTLTAVIGGFVRLVVLLRRFDRGAGASDA